MNKNSTQLLIVDVQKKTKIEIIDINQFLNQTDNELNVLFSNLEMEPSSQIMQKLFESIAKS